MAIEITSDSDMPKCLNTKQKQIKKALELASSHFSTTAKEAHSPDIQGFFSRTMIVTLKTGEKLVIQFRLEQLDMEPFKIARQILGPVVPEIGLIANEKLERDGIWTYWMTYMPGKIWMDSAAGRMSAIRVVTNRSLGRILSRGLIEGSNSEAVVKTKLRPHLELILSSNDDQIRQFYHMGSDLLGKLDRLEHLPLFVSHFDLNEVNILLDENCEVSGIIDWELSQPLPFGMGLCRIHTFAGEFAERKFYMPPDFDASERGFWEEIYNGAPQVIRTLLDTNGEVVQIALMLGTLLDAFQLDDDRIKLGPYNPVVVAALPKFFSYRIPFVRGAEPPYSI
ncbi:hypothetical protein L228DRAFT_263080 [Xylona heveae TC161]|uniref:Aminoglycoside phosphotransferase domain-containing protein n=1 Tax=Xylona heveae (strain CBS 132557 / TC161) TaxID=1328760 RepID=A0A165AGG6_XYLHT|nr:hypothetical protein L228DRAFT_263080 [Xylona heveae TC161]KZF20434.1 hypothetical protein L228DRAFT_263080 [Xylona heveae TC161]